MQLSQLKRLKKLWKYQVNDPGAGSGGSGGSNYDPLELLNGSQAAAMDDVILATLPTVAQKGIKHLRWEAQQVRGKYNGEKERAEAAEAKLKAYEDQMKAAQEEELKKQNQFKELFETQKVESAKESSRLRQLAINARIAGLATAAGIPAKLHGLIDPSGTTIDSNNAITGVEAAIERFMAENTDILEPFLKKPQEPTTPPEPNADPANQAANMVIPGSNMTFAQAAALAKNMGNVGADPPARGAKPPQKFDAMDKKKPLAEVQAELKKLTGKR